MTAADVARIEQDLNEHMRQLLYCLRHAAQGLHRADVHAEAEARSMRKTLAGIINNIGHHAPKTTPVEGETEAS